MEIISFSLIFNLIIYSIYTSKLNSSLMQLVAYGSERLRDKEFKKLTKLTKKHSPTIITLSANEVSFVQDNELIDLLTEFIENSKQNLY